MSISAADRARQNKALTQTREEAEEREVKLAKRKNEELKRAEQRHQNELKRLNEAYKTQLGRLKDEQSQTLSERQNDHQQDLAEVRTTYQTQLQKKMENQNAERKSMRETYENELDHGKKISESQKQNLVKKQEQELEKRDQTLSGIETEARTKMEAAINNNSRRMREAHDKEMTVMRELRDSTRDKSELEKEQLKTSYNQQLQNEKRQREFDNAGWRQKNADLYRRLNDDGESGGGTKAQLLKAESENLQSRYNKALDQRSKAMEESRQQLHETVTERVNDQVRSRDSKISGLQDKLNNQIVNDKRLRELERKNMQSVYEDKLEDLVVQKNSQKESFQELNAERLRNMKRSNDDVVRQTTQDYRSQSQIDKARYRETVANMEQQHLEAQDRTRTKADERIEKNQRVTEQNTKRIAEFYDDSMDVARLGYEKKVVDQRDRNFEVQEQNQRTMNDRFRRMEKSYNKKLATAIEQYESKLQQMKDSHEKEIRQMQAVQKTMMQDKEKGHKSEKDSVEMRYESKMAMIQQQHDEQLDKIQRRHQQELRDLAVKMNQYNKKA